MTQTYKLDGFTYKGNAGTVGDVAPAKSLADFPADFFVEVVEMPHTTILLPSPTQFMQMKFKSYAELQFSFDVKISVDWQIGASVINTNNKYTPV